jgi:hypothetical protein
MTRPEMRDRIRVAAELPGEGAFDVVINQYIDKELERLTSFGEYPETLRYDIILTWSDGVNPIANLPTDFMRLRNNRIFYIKDINADTLERTVLRGWSHTFNRDTGYPKMFRLTMGDTPSVRVVEIAPIGSIDFTNGGIYIDYVARLVWDETTEFPIASLQNAVLNGVAALLTKVKDTAAFTRLKMVAREDYVAGIAQNQS